MRQVIEFFRPVLAAGLAVLAAHTGCQPSKTPVQIAAESSYTAEQMACVEKAKTLAESKACRAEVDKKWGVHP